MSSTNHAERLAVALGPVRLPKALAERTRICGGELCGEGSFVLYWMRTAIRGDENPALDVAIEIANACNATVLVYQGLTERYPYASDRHHTFILEAAVDVGAALQRRNVGYALHVERPGQRGPYLRMLAERSIALVTEEMPVEPLNRWTGWLAAGLRPATITVDTACVVPMQLVGKAYTRAFEYRNATERLYAERITRAHPQSEPIRPATVPEDLPFRPIELVAEAIPELVAECDIDHTVGPVPHTPGGNAAGMERWETFFKAGLTRYDRVRNDATRDGVSRMSPYFHYGMVSPLRIARQAADLGNRGAEKYLDELLIWREMAYAYCFHRRDHGHYRTLPSWARKTLETHASDARAELIDWERMARAKTGDELWDAAQQSLLQQGELHNNVRMTWGKMILHWTRGPREALKRIIDLNHRYALDGRDPASYGGILWCLGQFDRPFKPPQSIFGTVRTRSSEEHARRLDVDAYRQRVTRPLIDPSPSVAVVGAGLSGLLAARTLVDHGVPVQVFEKSRGAGGRMATRFRGDGLRYDHGAQYFTARSRWLKRYLEAWCESGVVQRWRGRIVHLDDQRKVTNKSGTPRYVAVPGNHALGKHFAADVQVRYRTRVDRLERSDDRWDVYGDEGGVLGRFDAVLVTAPAPQTAVLLQPVAPELAKQAAAVKMGGCWALMVTFNGGDAAAFDGAFVDHSPLRWIARQGSLPGRENSASWVAHASPEWTEAHLEADPAVVQALLLEALQALIEPAEPEPTDIVVHRWRYALPTNPLDAACLADPARQLVVCGDWCGGPRVEGALRSGAAAAGRLLGMLTGAAKTGPERAGASAPSA